MLYYRKIWLPMVLFIIADWVLCRYVITMLLTIGVAALNAVAVKMSNTASWISKLQSWRISIEGASDILLRWLIIFLLC